MTPDIDRALGVRYRLLDEGRGIECLSCWSISYHPEDVRHRYCGYCHRFHDDPVINDRELFELRRLAFNLNLRTWRNYMRVARWPGALAISFSVLCNQIARLADAPPWARFVVSFATGYVAMSWLVRRAWRRYAWRKWNSLEA